MGFCLLHPDSPKRIASLIKPPHSLPCVHRDEEPVEWNHWLLQFHLTLELLCELDIHKTTSRLIQESGIVGRVAAAVAIGFRRILSEDVIAPDRDCGAIQDLLPDRQSNVRGLRGRGFSSLTIASLSDILCVLRVTSNRLILHRRHKSEVVGSLSVDHPCLANPVIARAGKQFMEAIEITSASDEIKAIPVPIKP